MTALATASRPATWDDVYGHEKTVEAVRSLLALPEDQIPHAFGLFGPGGFGKDTIAGLIARELVPDVADHSFCIKEVNAARYSTSEDMRKLLDEVHSRPMVNAPLVVILREFQRVKDAARDILLDSLEYAGVKEKGLKHLYWILTTSDPSTSFPKTSTRRLKCFDLDPVPDKQIGALLATIGRQQNYKVPAEVRAKIVTAAEGSPGMALSILETVAPSCKADMSPEDVEAVCLTIKAPGEAVGNLAQLLANGGNRDQVRSLLIGLKAAGQPAETVRRGVLGWCAAAYLGHWYKGDYNGLLEIMEIFCAGNTFDSDWAGLIVLAVNAAGRK